MNLLLMEDERGLKMAEIERERERVVEGGGIFCGVDLYVLPEGCIAAVTSFTSPRDACHFATISRIFKSAADSDSVWERFLPSDYRDLLARSDDDLSLFDSLSKKDFFMRLADAPIIIDNGSMSFSLDKATGKKCFTIAAKNLTITWGDTPRYWSWRSESKSRFAEVAELVTVCWLEIKGKMRTSLLSPNTEYAAYLVFKLTTEAFGFYSPAEATVRTAAGIVKTRDVFLEARERYQLVPWRIGVFNEFRVPVSRPPPDEGEDDAKLPKDRSDGWQEIKIGEFWTCTDEYGEVEMSLLEVKGGNWKGGLLVEGIEIRPKSFKERKTA